MTHSLTDCNIMTAPKLCRKKTNKQTNKQTKTDTHTHKNNNKQTKITNKILQPNFKDYVITTDNFEYTYSVSYGELPVEEMFSNSNLKSLCQIGGTTFTKFTSSSEYSMHNLYCHTLIVALRYLRVTSDFYGHPMSP